MRGHRTRWRGLHDAASSRQHAAHARTCKHGLHAPLVEPAGRKLAHACLFILAASCCAAFPSSLAMDDAEDEKTAIQKFLYPEDEELPENFEVRACTPLSMRVRMEAKGNRQNAPHLHPSSPTDAHLGPPGGAA